MRRHAQARLALVCSLMLLVAAMVIGVAVARGAFALMASARNEDDRVTARAAAEAVLRDAEHDIVGLAAGGADPARAAQFASAGGSGFADGCGRGSADLGLCKAASPAAWERIDLAADAELLVPYGRFTGAAFPLGSVGAPARRPAYLIERLEPAGATPAHGSFYRITAIGFGTRATTQVVLQTIYRKPGPAAPQQGAGGDPAPDAGAGGAGHGDAGTGATGDAGNGGATGDAGDTSSGATGNAGANDTSGTTGTTGSAGGAGAAPQGPDPPPAAAPPPSLPAGRIGWLELANWPELHARASR